MVEPIEDSRQDQNFLDPMLGPNLPKVQDFLDPPPSSPTNVACVDIPPSVG